MGFGHLCCWLINREMEFGWVALMREWRNEFCWKRDIGYLLIEIWVNSLLRRKGLHLSCFHYALSRFEWAKWNWILVWEIRRNWLLGGQEVFVNGIQISTKSWVLYVLLLEWAQGSCTQECSIIEKKGWRLIHYTCCHNFKWLFKHEKTSIFTLKNVKNIVLIKLMSLSSIVTYTWHTNLMFTLNTTYANL